MVTAYVKILLNILAKEQDIRKALAQLVAENISPAFVRADIVG